MKRGSTAGVQQMLLLFTILLTILTSCSKKDGEYYVDLYATNDLHGRFFDSLYVDNQAHPYSLAHISEWMRLVRLGAGKDNVMLIDLGDALQGDNAVYYANYIDTAKDGGKHLFTRIAEFMKYDALVVGNHDIEAGHPVYDRIKNETDIPYLAANAIDVATGKSYFKPYTILEKGGLKIAVIGMTNPNIKKWLGEELWSGIDFCPIEALADSLIQKVKATERPDITILAIHAGLGDGTAENIENPARYLAANLQGVDVIFASHDHQVACEKIWNGADSVLVMEGSNRAKFLSNVTAIVEYREGKLYRKKFTGRLIPVEKLGVDTSYANTFRNDFLNAKKFTNQEIGELEKDIYTSDAFFGPSDYMNLIHTVQLNSSDAEISLAAPLTYNGKIAAGVLKYHDLFTIYPFENQLYVVTLTGKQIKDYLEYSYDKWIQTMESPADHIMNIRYDEKRGRYSFRNMTFNFDSGAGFDYEVDVCKPYGEKITIKSMASGEPFEMEKSYKVALSSYRANGGGDLLTEGAGIPKDSLESIVVSKHDDIRSLVFDYYKNSSDSSKKITEATWKFVPEQFIKIALDRDRKLLFE